MKKRWRMSLSRSLLFPAEFSDQRYELRRTAVFDLNARPDAHHSRQPLIARLADRDDELPGPRQLFEQRLGHLGRCGRDDDAIERRLVGPAVGPVEYFDRGVVDLQSSNQLRGA